MKLTRNLGQNQASAEAMHALMALRYQLAQNEQRGSVAPHQRAALMLGAANHHATAGLQAAGAH